MELLSAAVADMKRFCAVVLAPDLKELNSQYVRRLLARIRCEHIEVHHDHRDKAMNYFRREVAE